MGARSAASRAPPAPHELSDLLLHGVHEEGLARAPVAEKPDRERRFEASRGEEVREGVDLGPDVNEVIACSRLVRLVVRDLDRSGPVRERAVRNAA